MFKGTAAATLGCDLQLRSAGCFGLRCFSCQLFALLDTSAHVKKGEPPSICTSLASPGARRKASTSDGVENCGSLVSNLVLTSTVRDRVGSTWRRRVRGAWQQHQTESIDGQHGPQHLSLLCGCLRACCGHHQSALLRQLIVSSCRGLPVAAAVTHLHHCPASCGIVPVAGVLQAKDDVLLQHSSTSQKKSNTSCLMAVCSPAHGCICSTRPQPTDASAIWWNFSCSQCGWLIPGNQPKCESRAAPAASSSA